MPGVRIDLDRLARLGFVTRPDERTTIGREYRRIREMLVAEGWRVKARMQQAGGDDAGAMISLQKSVVINPRHFRAMEELAEMLADYGDKPGALKLYRRVLALDPQMHEAAEQVKALSKQVEGQGI